MRGRVTRAIVADPDDQDLGPHGLESMTFFEVRLELLHQLFLDVHDAPAHLADGVMVVAARELIVRRTLAEVRGVYRT